MTGSVRITFSFPSWPASRQRHAVPLVTNNETQQVTIITPSV
jgi:hypothetical protein